MKHTYSVESFFLGSWYKLFSDSRDFCAGYLSHAQYEHPRLALRIVRSDGKIMHSLKEDTEVNVGMIVSYPTAEQYEAAAARALEKAAQIRAFDAKQEERRFSRIAATTHT